MSLAMVGAGVGIAAGVKGLTSGKGGSTQTQSKDPWGPAQEPLTNSLATGQDLERYYQKNPFNALQQQGYQNQFSDIDQYRNQISPELMKFANNAMTSNYQRGPRQSQMEMMQAQQKPMMMGGQQGGGIMGAAQGGGMPSGSLQQLISQFSQSPQAQARLMGGGQSMAQAASGGGLMSQPQGAFSAPTPSSYGLLDFQQLNPFTSANGIPAKPVADPSEKTPEQIWREEANQRERDRLTNIGGA